MKKFRPEIQSRTKRATDAWQDARQPRQDAGKWALFPSVDQAIAHRDSGDAANGESTEAGVPSRMVLATAAYKQAKTGESFVSLAQSASGDD